MSGDSGGLRVGDLVRVQEYGVGEVLSVELSGYLRVRFERGTFYVKAATPVADEAVREELKKRHAQRHSPMSQEQFDEILSQLLDAFSDGDGEVTKCRNFDFSAQDEDGGRKRPKGYAPWRPHKKTKIILAQVREILREYKDELPLTARQIFYRLVGAYGYPKTEQAYERLTNYLVRARRARMIDFEDIRDDRAAVMREKHYGGEEAFYAEIRQMGERYERDKLANQKRDIRVYCEAAGMMPQLRRVTSRFSVPVYSCSGFDSLTAKYDLANDIANAYTYRGRPTVILHLGDHDPSGETIFDAISEDVYAFLEVDVTHKDPREVAIFERVALTEEQIARYDLPTDPAKESSHSAGWGNRRACQLEALEPDVLARILEYAIGEHIDLTIFAADLGAEPQERRRIAKALPAPKKEGEND